MKVKFTELNSGYKGERRISAVNNKNKAKITVILTLVLLFVFVFVLSSVGVLPVDALFTRIKVGVTGNDQRFPIEINTKSTLDTDIIGESIVILTTENVSVYSDNGRLVYSEPHIFSKPGVSVNGRKAVVFDRGGKGFILIDEKKVVYKGEAENTIITAQYSDNGSYSLATKGKNATSTLFVYNKHHRQIFKWNCAYEYIVNIALSDNGKYVGAAVMGAEDGKVFTTVQYFGVDYKEPFTTQKIDGATTMELNFISYNSLCLITDKGSYIIDRKNKECKNIKEYYSAEFNSCQITEDGEFCVVLAKYASKNNFEINLFKKNGEIKATVTADEPILSTYISDKYIFALSENRINVFNYNGKEISQISYKGEVHSFYATDDFVFITSLNKITRCFSVGDSEIEI